MSNEGKAREPGGVEAGCANDYIDIMRHALMIHEAGLCDTADWVGKCGCVGGDEGFEVARRWGGATATGVEVPWDHFLNKARVVVEFLAHLCVGVFACDAGCFTALHDELEALVELVFDLFAVFEVLLWVVLEKLELFFAI